MGLKACPKTQVLLTSDWSNKPAGRGDSQRQRAQPAPAGRPCLKLRSKIQQEPISLFSFYHEITNYGQENLSIVQEKEIRTKTIELFLTHVNRGEGPPSYLLLYKAIDNNTSAIYITLDIS